MYALISYILQPHLLPLTVRHCPDQMSSVRDLTMFVLAVDNSNQCCENMPTIFLPLTLWVAVIPGQKIS